MCSHYEAHIHYVDTTMCGCIFYVCIQLGPNVTIGRNVVVGEGVRVRESIILEGATLQVGTDLIVLCVPELKVWGLPNVSWEDSTCNHLSTPVCIVIHVHEYSVIRHSWQLYFDFGDLNNEVCRVICYGDRRDSLHRWEQAISHGSRRPQTETAGAHQWEKPVVSSRQRGAKPQRKNIGGRES